MIENSFINGKQGLAINQEREDLVEKIVKLYRKAWSKYDKSMLVEQVKDLENPISGALKLTAEELIEHLINEDINNLRKNDILSLKKELRLQEQEG